MHFRFLRLKFIADQATDKFTHARRFMVVTVPAGVVNKMRDLVTGADRLPR